MKLVYLTQTHGTKTLVNLDYLVTAEPYSDLTLLVFTDGYTVKVQESLEEIRTAWDKQTTRNLEDALARASTVSGK